MQKSRTGVEQVYDFHHTKARGDSFCILGKERGAFLKKEVGTGKKVLDIGCRDGALTSYYREGNDVLGVDIDAGALIRAKERYGIRTQQVDLNSEWNIPDSSYDVVVAAEILEHLYYPAVILGRIARVLKPGGFLVGSVPHAFSLQSRMKFLCGIKRGTPLEDPTHINHFTYKEFKNLLTAQFDTVRCTPLIPKRYCLLSVFTPFAFAHMILFSARKKS